MKRKQLFEFTDISWWPNIFRCMTTDYLHVVMDRNQPFTKKISDLSNVFRQTNQSQVIDLCSGSIGPWLHLSDQLKESLGCDVNIVLTDKFPSASAATKMTKIDGVEYYPSSVDALEVPQNLNGVRTIFNALHHFKPDEAQEIITDAVKHDQAVVIFEILQRNWGSVFGAFRAPLALLLMTPFLKPFSFQRFLFTYVIPVGPITLLWDAIVSNLRCYTPKELEAMAEKAGGTHYEWHVGKYHNKSLPVTYMMGYPKKKQ